MAQRNVSSELIPHEAEVARYFAERPGVAVAYLFGSHARGQAHALSDIDLAVLLDTSVDSADFFDARLAMMGDISHILGRDDIDLVVLNEAPLALAYRVLRDGRVLACQNHDARVQFTARTVSLYLDFKPVRERHERAILERARRGELFDGPNPHRGALERYRRLRERLEGGSGSEL